MSAHGTQTDSYNKHKNDSVNVTCFMLVTMESELQKQMVDNTRSSQGNVPRGKPHWDVCRHQCITFPTRWSQATQSTLMSLK